MNATLTILWSLGFWSKLERWKSSINGYLVRWPKVKKKMLFWGVILSYSAQQQQPISWSNCDVQWKGFYSMIGNDPLSGWTEKKLQNTSQSQTCLHQKRSWSLFGGLLAVWSTTAFWIPVKPLHLSSMLSTLMRWLKTAMPAAGTGQQKGPSSSPSMMIPDCMLHNQSFKSWTNCPMKFCLIYHISPISRQLTTTSSNISTTFAG